MRFFILQDYQHWLLAVILGLVLAILVYLAFRSYGYSRERDTGKAKEKFHYPDGIEGTNFPMPPFLLFLYFGFIIWMICYVIFFGILHGPI
ncbi:MAG: hypothetical protein ACYDHW_15380 [Syntrophorhabdaceae bacterium]